MPQFAAWASAIHWTATSGISKMLREVNRLTSLDGSFLRVETPNAHMHVAWCGLFTPGPDRPRPTLEQVADSVEARLRFAPRFRQRLAFPPPGLGEPYWVDDRRFHVRAHVTRLAPENEPVSFDRFMSMAGDTLSEPLERDRPLWHLYFLPRLTDGRLGIVFKMHHALVDGKSAVELGLLLFDAEPDARAGASRRLAAGQRLPARSGSRSRRCAAARPARCRSRAA